MAYDEPGFGPLQLVVAGFETTENSHGPIARELRDLRGRGLVRVLGDQPAAEPQPRAAAAAVVRALVSAGFVRDCEAADAIEALAERGIVEQALIEGATAEAGDLLARLEDDPPPPPAGESGEPDDDDPPPAGGSDERPRRDDGPPPAG